jgi:hypothetical protein
MKESAPKAGSKIEQLELFEGIRSPAEARGEKRKEKKTRLPSARGYDIIGGYAENIIRKTRKPHVCRFCGRVIPPGSSAKEIIEVVDGILLIQNKEYAHLKGQCPPPDQAK